MILDKASLYAEMTQEQLLNYIEKHNGEQKALAYLIYGLTWNMIRKMLMEEKDNEINKCKSPDDTV